jgi:hypothetical protein
MDKQKELENSLLEQQAQLAALQASRPSKQDVDSLLEKYNTKVATAEEVALQQAMEAIGQNLQRIGQSLADIQNAKAEVVDIKKTLDSSIGVVSSQVSSTKENYQRIIDVARAIEAKSKNIEAFALKLSNSNDEVVFKSDLKTINTEFVIPLKVKLMFGLYSIVSSACVFALFKILSH